MDVLNLDWVGFLWQSVGLAAWICVVAAIYSVVEKAMGGPAAPEHLPKD
jgi:hypothetical protein